MLASAGAPTSSGDKTRSGGQWQRGHAHFPFALEATDMNDKPAHVTARQGMSPGLPGPVRRFAGLAVALALVFWSGAATPTTAQVRPGAAPDPIDQSRGLSTQPRPALPPSGQPTERLVPESRQREPGTGREIVTPPYYDRQTPDRVWQGPPPATYGPPRDTPPRMPGR